MLLNYLLPLGTLLAGSAMAVNTVEVQGQDFIDSKTNNRMYIIGVDYQPGGSSGYNEASKEDPLTNGTACLRDAAIMQQLGINTVRIYNVDPDGDHDDCASIFNYVGIYMMLDVNAPTSGGSINRADPSSSYTASYLERVFKMVEAFKNYPNTLGFFGANELINDEDSAKDNPVYIRAVQRDLKNYIKNNADRTIPVGYSAAQVQSVLEDTWEYLQCAIDGDDNDMSRADFFGLNSYSWCGGDATYTSSGYNTIVDMFENSSIPIFFSEYGCNEVKPRVFDEVQALYGEKMTSISGGLVYEWSQEDNDYGLVKINSDGSVTLRTDFNNLQQQFNKLNTTLIQSKNSSAATIDPPKCAKSLIDSSSFGADFDLPSTPSKASDMIKNGVSGANTGKIKDVTATAVPYKVYTTANKEVSNLSIKEVKDGSANAPSGTLLDDGSTSDKSSTGTSTSSSSKSSTSAEGAAGQVGVQSTGALVFASVLAVLLC
ncbi:beta glucanosyltransferase Gel2p [Phyllosticta capitalensis]